MNTTLLSLLLACFDADKEVETDSDDNPNTEVCDGIDNDGDGLVDEMLYYQTYDNNADVGIGYTGGEVTKHIDSRIGYVEVLQDGSLEETTDATTGETNTTITQSDGNGNQSYAYFYDDFGNLMQFEYDSDLDGFPEDLSRYTRDSTGDNNPTEYLKFEDGALYNFVEYDWTNNTPTGTFSVERQYIYGYNMEPIWEIDQIWTPTSRNYVGRFYLGSEEGSSETPQSYYAYFMDDEYTNALHMNRWQTLYLEEYFGYPQGEGSIYEQKYFEYRYNSDGMLAETQEWLTQDQTQTFPLDTSNLGILTELTYDQDGQLTHYKKSSSEGTITESFFTRENGLPVSYTLDSNGDGTIDYEYTIQYEDIRIVQFNEIVYDSEAYTDTIFAERTYTYDENHNLIQSEIDVDGDGTIDIVYDYVFSCESRTYSFDPADYDYGN